MKILTSGQLRALLPACPPAGWRSFVAFGLAFAAVIVLLDHGVSGGVLPAVLGWMTVLTVVLAGGSVPKASMLEGAAVERRRLLGGGVS